MRVGTNLSAALRKPVHGLLSPGISRVTAQRAPITIGSSDRPVKNQIYAPVRNNDSFYTYLSLSSSSRTPLLTFWTASWCGTCRAVSPLLRDLVESGVGEQEGGVGLAFVEFDSPDIMSGSPNLALTYMINSIPTLLSFDAGEAQTKTKVADARQLADRQFLSEWIRAEARRHGNRGGGGGSAGFGGLFGGWK
jgi:thiol-disulfide isomerase/thioredoxin